MHLFTEAEYTAGVVREDLALPAAEMMLMCSAWPSGENTLRYAWPESLKLLTLRCCICSAAAEGP